MPYVVTVTEIFNEAAVPQKIERYSQTVDSIEMKKIIEAVNYRKRERKAKEKNGGAQ